ncbi:MAG TPA: GntR family transcriptional regulator, partial [Citricoccus sp.]
MIESSPTVTAPPVPARSAAPPGLRAGGALRTFREPRRTTLAERAYREIRARIIDNRLAPGTPLDEEALIAELSIGRTPLREAVKRLESERLLTIYAHRGTFVPEVTIRDLR